MLLVYLFNFVLFCQCIVNADAWLKFVCICELTWIMW